MLWWGARRQSSGLAAGAESRFAHGALRQIAPNVHKTLIVDTRTDCLRAQEVGAIRLLQLAGGRTPCVVQDSVAPSTPARNPHSFAHAP